VRACAVDRRAFIGTVAGTLLTAPLAAEAHQAEKLYRVGLLGEKASDPSEAPCGRSSG